MNEGTQILRQTWPTKSKPGSEIRGRDVEASIRAKVLHHFLTVDSMCRTQISDFIRKCDFDRMECVVHIVQHFRGPNRRANDRSITTLIERLGHVAASRVQFANHNLTWMVIVLNSALVP